MFPCSGCGLCCMHISEVDELKEFDLGNGVCKHYDEMSKMCKIYENRPEVCRVDEFYHTHYSTVFTLKEFYKKNAEVCNYLQDKHFFDTSFRIKIEGD